MQTDKIMLSDQQKELENKPFLRENDTFE